ncbi:MAG: pilus assembly protein PilX [Pseudomonas sp.]|nr:pilus assembly protein PilX [Pseudomonas sp.]
MNTQHQCGMVLLTSLIFLLLLTLIGLSSLQNATLQEKMAGSLKLRNESFQAAEAALRVGESALRSVFLEPCTTLTTCAPPAEALTVTTAGRNPTSGVTWVAVNGGFYALQNFGKTRDPVNVVRESEADEPEPWTLYRITGVGLRGNSRTVLESVYAADRRITWRQIQ